jgi:prepilin-type N-terminal cleavage/methylation domain-containing protein
MRSLRYSQGRGGFTLIELLVAIALLGISMTLVLGIYSSVFSVVVQVDQKGSYQNRAGLLIDQLHRDFFGIYKAQSGFFRAGLEADQAGEIPLFEFTTTSRLGFRESAPTESISMVRYSLKKVVNENSFLLYRYEVPIYFSVVKGGDSGATRILVSERVADFRLSFKDRYGSFLDRWEARSSGMTDGPDDDRFPRLVRIELELAESAERGGKTKTLSHTIAIPISRYAVESGSRER